MGFRSGQERSST
ncbi:hypothetical protein OCT59_027308 [Rhizophagus irregularis]|nr:hypothetical protein OCT59_027308 [Rhizophagus irregularis]